MSTERLISAVRYKLKVSGDANISSTLNIGGALTAVGAVTSNAVGTFINSLGRVTGFQSLTPPHQIIKQ